jgi:hypothetical protein
MGVALFIVPEREIDDFDPFVNGKALGRSEDLGQIAEDAGVSPLMSFFSASSVDIAGLLGDDDDDESEEAPEPIDADWFDPDAGLTTVRGLIRHLSDHPQAAGNTEELLDDLQEFETVLSRLAREGVRWHLAVDV